MSPIKDHEKWMKLAFCEAEKAFEQNEVPIGSVVVHKGQIIGRGHNQCESLNDPTAHAEIIAITSAANTLNDWRLTGCELYVTKEPCPMCAGALWLSRIKRCVFGAYDPKGGFLGSISNLMDHKQLNHHYEIEGGVLAEECSQILRTFFRRLREKKSSKSS